MENRDRNVVDIFIHRNRIYMYSFKFSFSFIHCTKSVSHIIIYNKQIWATLL